jgi:hypothetical protein
MPDIFLKIVLPLIGMIIILLSIGAYFFKYGTRIKDCIQEFRMFGADMRVSIITVFIVVGLILIFAGTYFTVMDMNKKLAGMLEAEKQKTTTYQGDVLQLKGQVELLKRSQDKTVNYFLDLDSTVENFNSGDLKIYYNLPFDDNKQRTLTCSAEPFAEKPRLMVTFQDIKPGCFIDYLVVEDVKTKRRWKKEKFFPLSPSLTLTPVN